MFDALIDWIRDFWEDLKPFFIVSEFEKAVVLRYGKFLTVCDTGCWAKLPFFDDVYAEAIVWTTMALDPQSVTTKEGENVVVQAIIKYRIKDIKKFCLKVVDVTDAINDMTQGVIFEIIRRTTWKDCHESNLNEIITKQARPEAQKWGIEVDVVTITNLAKIKSYRIIGDFGATIPEEDE